MTRAFLKAIPVHVASIAALVMLFPYMADAQKATPGLSARDFRSVDVDRQTGRRTAVQGARAEPLGDGNFLLSGGIRLERYNADKLELLVEAPECRFDRNTKTLWSSSTLSVQTGDERFAIQGRGFHWNPTNSVLTISNEVQTTLRKQMLQGALGATNPAAGTARPQASVTETNRAGERVQIFSDEFEYRSELAVFRGNVRVVEQDGGVKCELLTAYFNEAGRLQKIIAEENVFVRQVKSEATGQRAVYLADDETFELTGDPRWKVEDREGQSDRIVINQAKREFLAERNVRLKMPAAALLPADLWKRSTNEPSTNLTAKTFVEVFADNLRFITNSAFIHGSVRVVQDLSELTCRDLSLFGTATNSQPQLIIADGDVVLRQGSNEITAARVDYDVRLDTLAFIGEPRWKLESQSGSSDYLTVHPNERKFIAQGNVDMLLPYSAMASLTTNAPAARPERVRRMIRITSSKVVHSPARTDFHDPVRATDGEFQLDCRDLAVVYNAAGDPVEIVAEHNVELRDAQRHMQSARAVYKLAQGTIDLTGEPRVVMPDHYIIAETIHIDRVRRSFHLRGNYRIEMKAKALTKRTEPKPPLNTGKPQ